MICAPSGMEKANWLAKPRNPLSSLIVVGTSKFLIASMQSCVRVWNPGQMSNPAKVVLVPICNFLSERVMFLS